MAKINLLPWREALRKEKQQEFFVMLGFFALIAAGIWGMIHFYHGQLIQYQQSRNKYIENQTELLDKKLRKYRNWKKRSKGF